MSLANDKLGIHSRYIAANVETAGLLRRSGYTNVISLDQYNFTQSGNTGETRVFVGEEAPGTNYDSIANPGDRYIQARFNSSGTMTGHTEFVFDNGWEVVAGMLEQTMSSTQILALHTTPVTVVPAPGASKGVVLDSVEALQGDGTGTNSATAYAGIAAGEDLQFGYGAESTTGDLSIAKIETTGFLDQTNSTYAQGKMHVGTTSGSGVVKTNTAINVALPAAITTGNFGLKVRSRYHVVSTTAFSE